MADFAPYQDIPPDRNRALSPPPPTDGRKSPNLITSPRASIDQLRRQIKPNGRANGSALPTPRTPAILSPAAASRHDQSSDGYFASRQSYEQSGQHSDLHDQDHEAQRLHVGRGRSAGILGVFGAGANAERDDVNLFATRLGLRLDVEACLAYLLLPPLGGILLLLLEHRSDYVRYHAWQSSLLFTFLFVVHLILSWSNVLSWILFTFDIVLILFLSARAYVDAATLDRFFVPIFGSLANSFVDDE